jgi:hypothetical protein
MSASWPTCALTVQSRLGRRLTVTRADRQCLLERLRRCTHLQYIARARRAGHARHEIGQLIQLRRCAEQIRKQFGCSRIVRNSRIVNSWQPTETRRNTTAGAA